MIEGCEDQKDEEFPIYEEEEEMCDSVLIIEENREGECIQEPAYDQYVEEEVDAHIEEEEDLSLVTNVLQVPKKEMEDGKWPRRSSYEDMVSQEVFNNLELKNQDQPQPQKLSCFKKGGEVRDSRKCFVFLINDFQVYVLCDVTTMDVCYLLLGYERLCPYQTISGGRSYMSNLYKKGDCYTLQPKKGKASPKPMVKMKNIGCKSIDMAAYTCSLDTKQQQTLISNMMQQLNTATNENADQWNYQITCISPTVSMCITCCPVMHEIILQLVTLDDKCVPKRDSLDAVHF